MTLLSFFQAHTITLPQPILKLCEDGLGKMSQNPDPHHNLSHVESIFDTLSAQLKNKHLDTAAINFSVLLPAIIWHDVWKGSHTQTTSPFEFLWRELWDGYGSARMLAAHCAQASFAALDPALLRGIQYAVRSHARVDTTIIFPKWFSKVSLRCIPITTLEAQILYDLDRLDEWSLQRLQTLVRAYLVPEKRKILTPQLVWIAKQWVLWRMLDATEVFLHFGWARSELRTRKKVLTKAFVLLWNKAERFLEVSRPEVAWYLHIPALVEKKYKARSYYSELKTTI